MTITVPDAFTRRRRHYVAGATPPDSSQERGLWRPVLLRQPWRSSTQSGSAPSVSPSSAAGLFNRSAAAVLPRAQSPRNGYGPSAPRPWWRRRPDWRSKASRHGCRARKQPLAPPLCARRSRRVRRPSLLARPCARSLRRPMRTGPRARRFRAQVSPIGPRVRTPEQPRATARADPLSSVRLPAPPKDGGPVPPGWPYVSAARVTATSQGSTSLAASRRSILASAAVSASATPECVNS